MKKFLSACIISAFSMLALAAGEPLIKNGDTIVFLGDSITNYGSRSESGYVRMVVSGLKASGVDVKWFNAGIPGHKAWQMLERFDKDVTARKPQWVTVSCGVNDVWFMNEQSTYEKYREQLAAIVKKAQDAGIGVILLTPTTALGEKANPNITKYAEFVREFAKKNNIPLADTNLAVRSYIDSKDSPPLDSCGNKATVDGVHMAPPGDREMARVVLRAMEVDEAGMAKAENIWQTIPEACKLTPNVGVPYDIYVKIEKLADERNVKVEDIYSEIMKRGIQEMLKQEGK